MWSRAEIDVAVVGNLYGVKGRQRQISPGSFSTPECPDVIVLGSVCPLKSWDAGYGVNEEACGRRATEHFTSDLLFMSIAHRIRWEGPAALTSSRVPQTFQLIRIRSTVVLERDAEGCTARSTRTSRLLEGMKVLNLSSRGTVRMSGWTWRSFTSGAGAWRSTTVDNFSARSVRLWYCVFTDVGSRATSHSGSCRWSFHLLDGGFGHVQGPSSA